MNLPSVQRGWTGTGLTHQGEVRESNQDALGIDNEQNLWIIADGMGGYAGGQVASTLAVTAIQESIRAQSGTTARKRNSSAQVTAMLTQAVSAAKTAIQERIAVEPDLQSMGTTVVVAWLRPDPHPTLAIAHIGDSRAYLVRNTQLQALTKDHSLVQRLLDEGKITPEEAWDHPKRNVIVRALGLSFPSTPDTAIHSLDPDDQILLCTDGLTKTLTDQEILATISEYPQKPEEACRQLIDRANLAGGIDNVTAVLITPRAAESPVPSGQ